MLNDPKVLIIEADPENAKELCAILKFINYSPIVVHDCLLWEQSVQDAPDILAVMVGSCHADNRLGMLLNEIHQFNENLPIYLLSQKGREPTVTIDSGSCILGRLDIPPNYAQLTSAIHRAEV